MFNQFNSLKTDTLVLLVKCSCIPFRCAVRFLKCLNGFNLLLLLSVSFSMYQSWSSIAIFEWALILCANIVQTDIHTHAHHNVHIILYWFICKIQKPLDQIKLNDDEIKSTTAFLCCYKFCRICMWLAQNHAVWIKTCNKSTVNIEQFSFFFFWKKMTRKLWYWEEDFQFTIHNEFPVKRKVKKKNNQNRHRCELKSGQHHIALMKYFLMVCSMLKSI